MRPTSYARLVFRSSATRARTFLARPRYWRGRCAADLPDDCAPIPPIGRDQGRGEARADGGGDQPSHGQLPGHPHRTRGPRPNRKTSTRLLKGAAIAAVSALCLALTSVAAIDIAASRLPPLALDAVEKDSVTVVDREDRLLRAFTTDQGRWRLPIAASDIDPRYFAILFAYEDKRFYEHSGIDYRAIMRAAYLLARHGRLMSGGSTLTMQVARLLEGKHERTGMGKIRQMIRARQLETHLSKEEILRLYLRLAPMGGNIEGVRAASLAYFGKEPLHLSAAEAALLVALPQSPERRRPDRNQSAALAGRNKVIDRAIEAGVLNAAEGTRAKEERIPAARIEFPKLAPHLAETEIAAHPTDRIHRLTLDRDIQHQFENLIADQTSLLGQKLSAAIYAIDHTTGEVVAHVGSSDYLDASRWGAIDMVTAVRSPGSTLKPFIYGLGFDGGLAHPETLIEDRPTRFGAYSPENFDDEFHGTVTVRDALGNSLNVPAVKMLSAVGPGKLIGRFRRAGISPELPSNATPSLAIALGGLGMTMRDLASLYVALARGGDPIPLVWRKDAAAAPKPSADDARRRRLMSDVAAWYVTDILKDAPPPPGMTNGQIAYKTGTSYGYRDAWAAGYDGKYTIIVWVGRPDGASTPGLMGRIAAAPILFDAMHRIADRRTPFRTAPHGVITVSSGADLPQPLKRFRDEGDEIASKGPFLDPPVLISFPPDRAELDMTDRDDEPLIIKAEGGALPLTWLIDGAPVTSEANRRELIWQPDGRGFVKLSVIDAKGRADRITVRLR